MRLSLTPELSVGAGYDDNLFLDPALAGAAPPHADAVIDIRPSLLAALVAHGHALTLGADYLERITPSSGDLRDLLLRVGWSSPSWHRLRLSLDGLYEHYEATLFPDNTFDLGGGEAALRLSFRRVSLQASYRFDARAYPAPSRNGQLDLDQSAAATLEAQLHHMLSLSVGYRFVAVSSNEPTAQLDRHRGEIGFVLRPHAMVTLAAGYAVWWQALPYGAMPPAPAAPGGPRTDLAHAATASLHVRPLSWLELFARYDLIRSTSTSSPGQYQLDQVIGGAAVSWTFARERTPPPPPLSPTVNGRDVTFRARARPGAVVAIVGDWSDWRPLPLAWQGGDRYAGTYTLPPGRHAYSLSIDGLVVPAPDAPSYVDDGFGGRNGAVDVP